MKYRKPIDIKTIIVIIENAGKMCRVGVLFFMVGRVQVEETCIGPTYFPPHRIHFNMFHEHLEQYAIALSSAM